jgi:NitT/TauT family transport system substrate-binding protein
MITRRDALRAALGAVIASACSRAGGERGVLRVAVMGNLTHAPVLVGLASGRVAASLAPLAIESRVLGAGPRVVEALLGGSVDVGIAGPSAIVAAHALHPGALAIVSGVCSGGASLVLARDRRLDDLAHTTLATPQLGSTQDVSLRKFLRARSLDAIDRGGDVRVTALVGALAKVELLRSALDGAWMPEPWATRLCTEAPAFRALDERELWDRGDFATAVVVARTDFFRERRVDVERFADAVNTEIARAHGDGARDEARDAVGAATHAKWDRAVWNEAWTRVRFTRDPLRETIATFARDASATGALRERIDDDSIARLFVG